jgi:hypothetical protein
MRRSTVLSLSPKLGFPGWALVFFFKWSNMWSHILLTRQMLNLALFVELLIKREKKDLSFSPTYFKDKIVTIKTSGQ